MRLEKWRNKKTQNEYYVLVEFKGSYMSGGTFIYHDGKPDPDENVLIGEWPAYSHPEGIKKLKEIGRIK